ncbi:preprotein translocase subunit SecE [Candidatus Dojkabacteria bacterium]|nr:preprotein translocase subunit SecE [Candidatus Dojkabacteria bacterium]
MKKKKNLIQKIVSPISSVFIELKRMEWLSTKEWTKTTVFVILFSLLIVLLIFVLDLLFISLRAKYLL